MPTPITFTATLTGTLNASDLDGAAVLITLCGFGVAIPAVPGFDVIADAGIPQKILTGSPGTVSVQLWGNDVISPSGTFYCISVLDANGNVVQAANYSFSGGGTFDLSDITPIGNPGQSTPSNYVLVSGGTSSVVFNTNGWLGPVTFDSQISVNVTYSTLQGVIPGQLVQFFLTNGGGFQFTWPINVTNPPLVDPAAGSTTCALFMMRSNGILYPVNSWS